MDDPPQAWEVASAKAEEMVEVVELQVLQALLRLIAQVLYRNVLVQGTSPPAAGHLVADLYPGKALHLGQEVNDAPQGALRDCPRPTARVLKVEK